MAALRVLVLDDYPAVAEGLADWSSLTCWTVEFVHTRLADEDALVARLADADAVVLMRERTPFPAPVLERLPRLRLVVTGGMRNAAVDLAAASRLGVTVCGVAGTSPATAELAWGLLLALLATAHGTSWVGASWSCSAPQGHLVNTSRAGLVDPQALLDALHSGSIAGAALDVFEQEPLSADDPLLSAPNTVLSPHLGYVTRDNYAHWYGGIVEDLRAFASGSPLRVLDDPHASSAT